MRTEGGAPGVEEAVAEMEKWAAHHAFAGPEGLGVVDSDVNLLISGVAENVSALYGVRVG